MFFNRDFVFNPLLSGALQTITPDALGNLAVTNVKFPENGYLYVYVCDESAMDVYFDNLQIIHYTNPLTEVNDYYPFGLLAKTSTSPGGTPQNYKYNGKELQKDLAFNVLDYGARQYDPVSGRWLQVDPKADWYYSMSPYNYAANNPIILKDPNGQWIESAWDAFSLSTGVTSLINNIRQGNVSAAIVDGVGIAADAVAVVLPLVPGGVSAGIKAYRAADNMVDAAQSAKTADKVGDTKKTYQTYTKDPQNPADGVYSGKTSGTNSPQKNVANRDKNHHMNETHGPAKLDKSSSKSDAIRGREQNLIDKSGGAKKQGGNSGNTNRGVSEKNKNAQKYDNAAKKEFGN